MNKCLQYKYQLILHVIRTLNRLRPGYNVWNFADDLSKHIFLKFVAFWFKSTLFLRVQLTTIQHWLIDILTDQTVFIYHLRPITILTHQSRNKMVTVLQTNVSYSSLEWNLLFLSKFHWIHQITRPDELGPNRRQTVPYLNQRWPGLQTHICVTQFKPIPHS